MSLEFRIKATTLIGAACLALGGCAGCYLTPHIDREPYTIKVQEKQVKRYKNSDKYLIFGILPDGSKKVFENTDSLLELKFDSSDIYAALEEGKTFKIRTYGWRVPLLSWYENILSVELVDDKKKE